MAQSLLAPRVMGYRPATQPFELSKAQAPVAQAAVPAAMTEARPPVACGARARGEGGARADAGQGRVRCQLQPVCACSTSAAPAPRCTSGGSACETASSQRRRLQWRFSPRSLSRCKCCWQALQQ